MDELDIKLPSAFADQAPQHLSGAEQERWCHWMAASHNMTVYREAHREACIENAELHEALSVARIRMTGHEAEKAILKSELQKANEALEKAGVITA